jgi:hypothetical protein
VQSCTRQTTKKAQLVRQQLSRFFYRRDNLHHCLVAISLGFFHQCFRFRFVVGIFILYTTFLVFRREQVKKAGRAGALRKFVVHFFYWVEVGSTNPLPNSSFSLFLSFLLVVYGLWENILRLTVGGRMD